MSARTPGPWKHGGCYVTTGNEYVHTATVEADGLVVANLNYDRGDEEAKAAAIADAYLIAAAPELLVALEMFVAQLNGPPPQGVGLSAAEVVARAAIAKARGGA